MDYRPLGNSGLDVGVIGLGCWEFGRNSTFATDDEATIARIIDTALDRGMNLFDTAQGYGNGMSEELLGRGLKGRRDRAVIATKFRDFDRWEKGDMLEKLDGSLRRLGTDYVDIYQMHWPKTELRPKDIDVMVDTFDTAKRQGKIRFGAVSNFRTRHLDLLSDAARDIVVSNQVPYSLLWRTYEAEGALEASRERGIGIIPYSPLAQGLLTGRFTLESRPPSDGPLGASKWVREGIYEEVCKVVAALAAVAEEVGKSPAQVALNWLLLNPAVTCMLVGTRKPKHLLNDLGAVGWRLDAAHAQRVDAASRTFQQAIDTQWRGIWGKD